MKTIKAIITSAALLMATALFFACTPREDAKLSFNGKLELHFGDGPQFSKADVSSESGSFLWGLKDTVAISFDGVYHDFFVNGGTVDVAGTSGTRDKYALFPYTAVPASGAFNGETPRVTYPATYNTSGDETESRMPLLAVNDPGSNHLTFYHVGALLRIKLEGFSSSYKSVKVSFQNTTVTGTFEIADAGTPAPKANASNLVAGGGKDVVFNLPDGRAGRVWLNVPLPLQTCGPEKLTLTLYPGHDATGADTKVFETDINLRTLARADGRFAGFTITGLTSDVSGVEITHAPFQNTLFLHDSPYFFDLQAKVTYSTAAASDDQSLVYWESEDSSIVSVDLETGVIVAITPGATRIHVKSMENPLVTSYVDITVEEYSAVGSFVEKPFSVGSGRTVTFSPGYLQVTLTENQSAQGAKWEFARYQYDYLGAEVNATISLSPGSRTDLFYSPNGPNFGITDDEKLYYMDGNVKRRYEYFDWGMNKIYYRGTEYPANSYRAMSFDEWDYIFNRRTGDDAAKIGSFVDCRYSCVTVNNIDGVLLYPDKFTWNRYTMGEYPTRVNVVGPSVGNYSGMQWLNIEKEGAVFLPYAGVRNGQNYVPSTSFAMRVTSEGAPSASSVSLNFVKPGYEFAKNTLFTRTGSVGLSSVDLGFEGATAVRLVKDEDNSTRRKPVRKIEIDQSNYTNEISPSAAASHQNGNHDAPAYYYVSMPKDTDVKTITATVYYCDGTTSSDVTMQLCKEHINTASLSSYSINSYYCSDGRLEYILDPVNLERVSDSEYKLTKKSIGYNLIRIEPKDRDLYSAFCFVGASRGTFNVGSSEYEVATSDVWADVNMNSDYENPNADFYFAPEAYSTIPAAERVALDTTKKWMPCLSVWQDPDSYYYFEWYLNIYHISYRMKGSGSTDVFFYPATHTSTQSLRKYFWRGFDHIVSTSSGGGNLIWNHFRHVWNEYIQYYSESWPDIASVNLMDGVTIRGNNTPYSNTMSNLVCGSSFMGDQQTAFHVPSRELMVRIANYHIAPGCLSDSYRAVEIEGVPCVVRAPLGVFYPEILSYPETMTHNDYQTLKRLGFWIHGGGYGYYLANDGAVSFYGPAKLSQGGSLRSYCPYVSIDWFCDTVFTVDNGDEYFPIDIALAEWNNGNYEIYGGDPMLYIRPWRKVPSMTP